MTKTSSLGLPYGNCSTEDPLQRKDTNDTRYTFKSCVKRCLQKRVWDKCGCLDVSLPVNVRGIPDTDPEYCGTIPQDYPNATCLSAKLDPKCYTPVLDHRWVFSRNCCHFMMLPRHKGEPGSGLSGGAPTTINYSLKKIYIKSNGDQKWEKKYK